MDYNQQRRYRNGYSGGRQMNDARAQTSGDGSCGCRQGQRGRSYDGRQGQRDRSYDGRQGQRDRGYDGRQGQRDRSYESRQRQNDRSYDSRTGSSDNTCNCRDWKDDGCTYTRQKGYLEESYGVGMGYIPWQSWNCTHDGHRGLMSGTIFPELEKPFCAAGRCRQ